MTVQYKQHEIYDEMKIEVGSAVALNGYRCSVQTTLEEMK